MLGVLVVEPTVTQMAADAGVAASDEDAQAFLDQVVEQSTPDENPTFGPASLAIARYFVAFTNLSDLSSQEEVTADITKKVADLDVEVNPRFGTLGDGQQDHRPDPAEVDRRADDPAAAPGRPDERARRRTASPVPDADPLIA